MVIGDTPCSLHVTGNLAVLLGWAVSYGPLLLRLGSVVASADHEGRHQAIEEQDMSEVIEFTLQAKPGHYQQVMDLEVKFVDAFFGTHPSLKIVLVVGDPSAGIVRAIAVYDTHEAANAVNSDPDFAEYNDLIESYTVGSATRIPLDLINTWSRD